MSCSFFVFFRTRLGMLCVGRLFVCYVLCSWWLLAGLHHGLLFTSLAFPCKGVFSIVSSLGYQDELIVDISCATHEDWFIISTWSVDIKSAVNNWLLVGLEAIGKYSLTLRHVVSSEQAWSHASLTQYMIHKLSLAILPVEPLLLDSPWASFQPVFEYAQHTY